MSRAWQVQEAKNKLSAVIDEALAEGPQIITRHGKEVAIVLSYETYCKMVAAQPKLSEFFHNSPFAGEELDLRRDPSPLRDAVEI